MSKFLSQKRKLLEDVFEKTSNETTEKSFSGILKSLERNLLDDFKINLSYKTFETYYKAIVENDKDYNIKPVILDDLSNYLGYDSFKHYCLNWKTIEYTISNTVSRIVINITNKPIFSMPDIIKQNGLGIMEIILLISLVTGNVVFSNNKKMTPLGFMSGSGLQSVKECMYWNGSEYRLADCKDKNPHLDLKPADSIRIKYFKRIERKDTLTVENALGKTWYSKYNGEVEFFTDDGRDPNNGRELRKSTPFIIEKYAGKPVDSIEVQE